MVILHNTCTIVNPYSQPVVDDDRYVIMGSVRQGLTVTHSYNKTNQKVVNAYNFNIVSIFTRLDTIGIRRYDTKNQGVINTIKYSSLLSIINSPLHNIYTLLLPLSSR